MSIRTILLLLFAGVALTAAACAYDDYSYDHSPRGSGHRADAGALHEPGRATFDPRPWDVARGECPRGG
jgi:hypothetical protein